MNLFTCKRHTVSGGERRPLRLLVALLLLELPELGLDGHRRLLGFGVLHVDVKVLGDVRLGGICKDRKKLSVSSGKWTETSVVDSPEDNLKNKDDGFYNDDAAIVSLQIWTV